MAPDTAETRPPRNGPTLRQTSAERRRGSTGPDCAVDCATSSVAVSETAQGTNRDGARIGESDEGDDFNVSLSDYGVEHLTGSLSAPPGIRTRYARPLTPDHRSSHHPSQPLRRAVATRTVCPPCTRPARPAALALGWMTCVGGRGADDRRRDRAVALRSRADCLRRTPTPRVWQARGRTSPPRPGHRSSI